MCFFECDESPEFYDQTPHAATEPTKCGVCDFMVPAGGWLETHEWGDCARDEDDEPDYDLPDEGCDVVHLCFACAEALNRFGKHHGSWPTPDWFVDALVECYAGASKTDKDVREWRDVHAGILLRSRQAASREVTR